MLYHFIGFCSSGSHSRSWSATNVTFTRRYTTSRGYYWGFISIFNYFHFSDSLKIVESMRKIWVSSKKFSIFDFKKSTAEAIISQFNGIKADLVVCDGAPDGMLIFSMGIGFFLHNFPLNNLRLLCSSYSLESAYLNFSCDFNSAWKGTLIISLLC